MKRPRVRNRHAQRGAATLLVALVLMMAITVVTLSVAHTQLVEQTISSNESWHLRLSLQAEAALANAMNRLAEDFGNLSWSVTSDRVRLEARWNPAVTDTGTHTDVLFSRTDDGDRFVSVQVTAARGDGSGLQATVTRLARPLGVLTPGAETAPPLVVNGCVTGTPSSFDIRPREADTDRAGDAVWLRQGGSCVVPPEVDVHGGRVIEAAFGDDLWPAIFSVDRETYAALVDAGDTDAAGNLIYRRVVDADLTGGRWTTSLGAPRQHVVLYFPAETGCPEFGAGVRIYGVVFIDATCAGPLGVNGLEIFGSLVINGDLNVSDASVQLNHIQVADALQAKLDFPVLRAVPVPGSWRDF